MKVDIVAGINRSELDQIVARVFSGRFTGWLLEDDGVTAEVTIQLSSEREGDEQLFLSALAAHAASASAREAAKPFDAEILRLERSVTPRMLREAALGDATMLRAVNDDIVAQRSARATAVAALE